MLMSTDVERNLVEIRGMLKYCTESPNGTYPSGIAFIGAEEQVLNFIVELIKEYNYRRSEFIFASSQSVKKK
jgi:hypothetical protein